MRAARNAEQENLTCSSKSIPQLLDIGVTVHSDEDDSLVPGQFLNLDILNHTLHTGEVLDLGLRHPLIPHLRIHSVHLPLATDCKEHRCPRRNTITNTEAISVLITQLSIKVLRILLTQNECHIVISCA